MYSVCDNQDNRDQSKLEQLDLSAWNSDIPLLVLLTIDF